MDEAEYPPAIQPNVNVNIGAPQPQPMMQQMASQEQQKKKTDWWKILKMIERICLYVGGAIKGAREIHEEIILEDKAEKMQKPGPSPQNAFQQIHQKP